tara:strand:- start:923 stop:1186 length:264 start_codon:yes stop_codon:yes gene_type:complete
MNPTITRTTANRIIQQMDEGWLNGASDLIKRIDLFHIYQNGRCLTRYRFMLKDGAILSSFGDWKKYNSNDPHAIMIDSLHQLTDRKL